MRIIVLDGWCVSPGDIGWDALCELGDVQVYDRTDESELISRAAGAQAIFTNKCPITKETMQSLPHLRYIGVLATGYNVVDTAYAKEAGIVVTNIPSYSTQSVAQHVFALILEIASRVGEHDASVKNGMWQNNPDFSYCLRPLTELSGKTIGIIGHGAIGSRVDEIARAFGMNVIAYSPSKCEKSVLEDLYRYSDIITLNCPLTKSNAGMINHETISLMKKGVWIINTARGGLVNENDIKAALDDGKIGAYAADVASVEPIKADNPLLQAKNVILTPHIAWAPREARLRLMEIAVSNLRSFMKGNIINCVNA